MAQQGPGSYIVYKGTRPGEAHWPAIVYPDENAPQHVLNVRPPSGYFTLVLLLGDPLRCFRWASSLQMLPLTTMEEVCSPEHSIEVREAFEHAIFMRSISVGLSYWKNEVVKQFGNVPYHKPQGDAEHEDEELPGTEEEVEQQLAEALRISREEHDRFSAESIPTPSASSSPQPRRQKNHAGACWAKATKDGSEDFDLCDMPIVQTQHHSSQKRSRTSGYRTESSVSSKTLSDGEELPPKRRKSLHVSNADGTPSRTSRQEAEPSKYQGRSTLQCIQSFNQGSAAPTSDVIDGELAQSKDFVQVRIGRKSETRTLQMRHLWNRDYFRDPRAGINYFTINDEGAWVLSSPKLSNITVEDFDFVAEFITDNAFGIRFPEDQEQNKEAIAQCVAAWETAERLGMVDMLEYIGEKVKYLEWELADVITLAIHIYRAGPRLPEDDPTGPMRDWVSHYIAHHFWAYIRDDHIATAFRKRIRSLKELERDVIVQRGRILTTGAEMDEDEESDEEELGNDDDL